MAKQYKIDIVQELKEKIERAQSIVFVDYKGIKVSQDTELRRRARAASVEYIVAKNRMFKIALKEAGIDEDFDEVLKGTTAFAFSYEDAIAPAKLIFDFAKETTKKDKKIINIKAGCLEGKRISATEVEDLAKLPPREVLVAKLLGSLQSPISGLVNVLQGNIRNLVYVLNAIKENK